MLFKFSNEQLNKRSLRLSAMGSGSSKVKDKFDTLTLYFNTSDELTIDTGRKLLMEVTNEFLKSINEDKDLERFLYKIPFSFKDIKLSLSVSNVIEGHKYYPEGFTNEKKITYLILSRGIITYYIHTKQEALMQEVHEESYEEALKILEKENDI